MERVCRWREDCAMSMKLLPPHLASPSAAFFFFQTLWASPASSDETESEKGLARDIVIEEVQEAE